MTKINEDFVSFHIKEYLILHKNVEILLYDPPGGGRSFSVPLSGGELIYPDIVGRKDNTIIIVENKASYCKDDVVKLNMLREDESAVNYLQEKINQLINKRVIGFDFVYFHGFHFRKKSASHDNNNIGLVFVDANGVVTGDLTSV